MIGIEAQQAVCAVDCRLAPELRHLIMVLAVLADRRTGEGISGQDRIAAAMGVSPRTVRRLLAELTDADSPVIVLRKARMRKSGRGRTSDNYALAVQPDAGDRLVGSDQPATDGHVEAPDQAAAGDRKVSHDQPVTAARPTGHAEHDQPATGDRASYPSRDPSRDPRRSSPRGAAASIGSPKRAARARAGGPQRETDPRVLPLRDYYVERYRAANQGAEPALSRQSWGRAMRAFAELLDAAKSEERARLCIERTFASADAFTRRRCQPWEIAADANKLLAERPATAKTWVQRGGGDRDFDEALRRGAERFGGAP